MKSGSNLNGRLRIIALGYIVRWPLGGMVWSNLHFLMGLRDLGHEVYYFEDSDDYASCYDPARCLTDTNPSYGLSFAANVLGKLSFGEHWAFHDAHTSTWHGPLAKNALSIAKSADLVLNLACANPLRPWLRNIPKRVYLDEDPAFTQIRLLTDERARLKALEHNFFATFGENIPRGTSHLPLDNLPWVATRQPVYLNAVPGASPAPSGKFTTVMQWQSYRTLNFNGIRYGVKAESFEPLLDLPGSTGPVFQIALGGPNVPRAMLRGKGWDLVNPLPLSQDPWTYETFIRHSRAEFGLAKEGYVVANTGWFSERSACYLAMGRPVLAQETGFSEWLKCSAGVVPFTTPKQAADGVREITSRYAAHCSAARAIAEEYFHSRKILTRLLNQIYSIKAGVLLAS
ncbi:MAG TPA: hypothetical protein VN673_04325 [Clostridia bacterium]|nr:hypothetical protein [Clostridia bacterium]